MAAINLGTSGSRRETNRELALVPFIDFLLCLVAFLLVTAVWTEMSRLPANAMLSGKPDFAYGDLVGVMDAVRGVKRADPSAKNNADSAFAVSFAVD